MRETHLDYRFRMARSGFSTITRIDVGWLKQSDLNRLREKTQYYTYELTNKIRFLFLFNALRVRKKNNNYNKKRNEGERVYNERDVPLINIVIEHHQSLKFLKRVLFRYNFLRSQQSFSRKKLFTCSQPLQYTCR
jgi:hypothetical protein